METDITSPDDVRKAMGMGPLKTIMQRRRGIEEDYTIKDGIIASPGKFENEPVYVAAYYGMVLDGFSDDIEEGENGEDRSIFILYSDDTEVYPELKGYTKLVIWSDDQGFVSHELLSE